MNGSSTLIASSAITSVIFAGSRLFLHVVYGHFPVNAVGTQISEFGKIILALVISQAVVNFFRYNLSGRSAVTFALIAG